MRRCHTILLLVLFSIFGCGPIDTSATDLPVGTKLYQNGELWGTIVEVSGSHTFDNGAVEPGVKVEYGPDMGEPQWLPLRSARKFDVESQ
jgi:hypothetical protein